MSCRGQIGAELPSYPRSAHRVISGRSISLVWSGVPAAIGGLVGLEQTTWLSAERHVHDGA